MILKNKGDRNFYKNAISVIEKHYQLSSKNIKLDIIGDNKPKVRNLTVHEGTVPYHGILIITMNEIAKFIAYVCPSAMLTAIPSVEDISIGTEEVKDPAWEKFLSYCELFSKDRTYVLIVDVMNNNSNTDLLLLSRLNWSMIIDLDPESEQAGFYKTVAAELAKIKKVHLFTPEQQVAISPFSSLYWLAGNGIAGRPTTLTADIKEWRRKSKQLINNVMIEFARALEPPFTTVIISDSVYIKDICECIDNSIGENNLFVYALQNIDTIKSTISEYAGKEIEISIPQIVSGLRRFTDVLNIDLKESGAVILPGKDESDVILPIEEFRDVEEYLTVVHKNIVEFENKAQERIEFLKGDEISWYGLNRHYDVDRDVTAKLIKLVDSELVRRENPIIFLNYFPGFGGTTVVKRVAWHFHNLYPTVQVLKYDFKITANKINKIYMATNKPVLILLENYQVSSENIARLCREVKALTFPATFLVSQRHAAKSSLREGKVNSSHEVPMPPSLSNNECGLFIDTYKEFAPERVLDLDKIMTSHSESEKHPFYIGLVAFLEDFKGLKDYITKAFIDATDKQKKMAAFISITYCYGKQESYPHVFNSLLDIPENKVIKLNEHLNTSLNQILISVQSKDGKSSWRPVHHLVGKEIVTQVLAGSSADTRLWKNNLCAFCLELIDMYSSNSIIPTDKTIDLLKKLFIFKDDDELLEMQGEKARFSLLIEETPQPGRLVIFKKLVEVFPREAHFWAHLGRYYTKDDINIDKAYKCFDEAIALSDDDPLLFHMKGMCIVSRIKVFTKESWGNVANRVKTEDAIKPLVDEANNLFSKSRDLRNNAYGFVSNINMLTHIIDFGFHSSGITDKAKFINSVNYSWYREMLDLAEDLMENAKRLYEGNESYHIKEFHLIERCNQRISEIYGDYSSVIQGWNNLLTKNIYKADIRRQIVRAYNRKNGGWEKIEPKVIATIIDHMETNIREEPAIGKNIYLWFQAAKFHKAVDIDTAISNVSSWNSTSDSLDSIYYLFILHVIKAIQGFSDSRITAEKLSKLSSDRNRFNENRIVPFEWYGKGTALDKIKNISLLGPRDSKTLFWTNTAILDPVEGYISNIEHAGKGNIELVCGLKAFFTPAHGNGNKGYFVGDENVRVKFFLAFSYDGLRAYKVESVK